jgi:hypothetical protein
VFAHSSFKDKWKPAIMGAVSQYGHLLSEQQVSELKKELPPAEQQEPESPQA